MPHYAFCVTSILDAIDGALQDWEADAMHWSPEPAEQDAMPPATLVVALDPAVSVSGPGGPWLAVGSFADGTMRLAIEEQERQVREVLMRGTLPLAIDGELWPPPPPVPASQVLGPVPGNVAQACEEAASRLACWPCQAKAVPGEPSAASGRRRRLAR